MAHRVLFACRITMNHATWLLRPTVSADGDFGASVARPATGILLHAAPIMAAGTGVMRASEVIFDAPAKSGCCGDQLSSAAPPMRPPSGNPQHPPALSDTDRSSPCKRDTTRT